MGVLHSEIRIGAFKRETFAEFLGDVCASLHRNALLLDPIFVLDNCRIHCNEDLERLLDEFGFEFRFLPPWSPMFNPIEGVFSDFKRAVRTELSTTHKEELMEIDFWSTW